MNLYEVLFSARTTASEILENMLLHLRAETLGERLVCLNLYEVLFSARTIASEILVATVLFPVLGFRGDVTEHMEKKMDAMFCFLFACRTKRF